MTSHKSRMAFLVAAIALVAALIPTGILLMWPDLVLRMGMGEKLWYMTALMLGLGVAISLFALFTSSMARYKGESMGGAMELGGPPALVVVFLILAFYLPAKPSSKFDLTVFLQLPEGASTTSFSGVKVRANLSADARIEEVDAKGVARFVGIPFDLIGKEVPVSLIAPLYELAADSSEKVVLNQEAIYLKLQWKRWQLEGKVLDESGQPISDAKVLIAGQNLLSDSTGNFMVTLSKQLPESKLVLEVQHEGYRMWRNQIGSGSEMATIQLVRNSK